MLLDNHGLFDKTKVGGQRVGTGYTTTTKPRVLIHHRKAFQWPFQSGWIEENNPRAHAQNFSGFKITAQELAFVPECINYQGEKPLMLWTSHRLYKTNRSSCKCTTLFHLSCARYWWKSWFSFSLHHKCLLRYACLGQMWSLLMLLNMKRRHLLGFWFFGLSTGIWAI